MYTFGESARRLDPFQPIAAENRHHQTAAPGLAENLLCFTTISRDKEKISPTQLRESVEEGPDLRGITEIGIDRLQYSAAPHKIPNEGLPHAPAILIVQIEHGTSFQLQGIMYPLSQRDAMSEIARADSEGVITGGGDVRRGRWRGDGGSRIWPAIVHWGGSQGHAGEDVTNDRR